MPSITNTFYYSSNTLQNFKSVNFDNEVVGSLAYKKTQQSILYSDSSLTTASGSVFYDISVLDLPTTPRSSYDCELGYIFFTNPNDVINISIALYSPDVASILSSGTYQFPVTGGQGTYLNATGSVQFVVSSNGLRTVTFNVIY